MKTFHLTVNTANTKAMILVCKMNRRDEYYRQRKEKQNQIRDKIRESENQKGKEDQQTKNKEI